MSGHNYLAFDLGAESGRAVLGTLTRGRLSIREIHRFPNGPRNLFGRLHWNIYGLWDEMKTAMAACSAQAEAKPESIAVDTWGVDFGLLGKDGEILGLPFAYRDLRNVKAMEKFFEKISKERIYEVTGIQFMPFNSLFQLHALALENPALLESAAHLLFMPNIFTYFLTGQKTTEPTIASTSQLLDPRTRKWSPELFAALGVSVDIMPGMVTPGTRLGNLLPDVAQETGLVEISVVATAGHDTASAVAAVPASGKNWAYISSGTWSVMGIETHEPLITAQTHRLNFTNEGGMENTIRFLKNIAGLWLVQQCRKKWSERRPVSYEELAAAAATAEPFRAFVDPDAGDFLNPPDMPAAIQRYCRDSGQAVPQSQAEIIRCALESLALKYRAVLEELKQVSPRPIDKIHIIGGGSKNELLCRFAADATALPVVTGPAEATAIGNIMGQALALGHVGSLKEIRDIIAASTELKTYEPRETDAWGEAFGRFQSIRLGKK